MAMNEDQLTPDIELTKIGYEMMPFTKMLGIEVVTAAAEKVLARADWAAERCTAAGVLHGGYLMSLADTVGAVCGVFNLPQGAVTSTLESKTNFFRKVKSGYVTITAEPVHVGRSNVVVQTDIVDADGRLVSRTTQTQAVKVR